MSISISGKRDESATPCRGICSTTNLGDEICKGCGRTKQEVIDWNTYSRERKKEINLRIRNEKGNH